MCGVVFSGARRGVRLCSLMGSMRDGSCMLMLGAGFNIEWSTSMASLLVGSIVIQWSRWYFAHPKVFTVSVLLLLFPGISSYPAMLSSVHIRHPAYCHLFLITVLVHFL
ncbi:threonine/serine exporter family protein [Salmonella enterica]|uniref:threonine/serine exporter family protein n=1 Tax=Salmonella enterica TaxID=28901 RepID=UPI00398C2F0E